MGSIASRPKSVTAAATVSAPVSGNVSATDTNTAPLTPDPQEIAKTRVENILRHSRSALGNIYTSLRGVLSPTSIVPQRKNLLGE